MISGIYTDGLMTGLVLVQLRPLTDRQTVYKLKLPSNHTEFHVNLQFLQEEQVFFLPQIINI